ncbi:MAG: hypothetical protein WAM60_10425 [Candidatus Promineifilaceae bacterium]
MSLFEQIDLSDFLARLRVKRPTTLPIILITLLGVSAVVITLVNLWPNWQRRQALMDELAISRSLFEQQALIPQPDRSSLNAQALSLRQELIKAQENFVSEAEVDAILNQMYEDTNTGSVTIDSLQAQTAIGEDGEQLPQVGFRIKASGSPSQLLNFVGRINQASMPGVELDNLSIGPSEKEGVSQLMMDIRFHTIPVILDPPTPSPSTPTPAITTTTTLSSTTDITNNMSLDSQ